MITGASEAWSKDVLGDMGPPSSDQEVGPGCWWLDETKSLEDGPPRWINGWDAGSPKRW